MADTLTRNKAEDQYILWEAYQSERDDWALDAANDEDFYMGNQWTKKEIAELTLKGMAPLVVNRVMPVIQQELAVFLSKRPTLRYLPFGDNDVEKGKLFSDIAAHIWHVSNGDTQLAKAVQDYFVVGAGYLISYVDQYADEGRGEVKFQHLPWADVYPDPNSREMDLSDARYIFISRLIDKETLMFNYPDKAEAINAVPPEEGPVSDRPAGRNSAVGRRNISELMFAAPGSSGKVRVIEGYKKVRVKRIKLFDTMRGTSTIIDEKYVDYNGLPAHVRPMPIYETQIEVTVTAGRQTILDEYNYEMDMYPAVAMYLHHAGSPMTVKGDVSVIKGMQQEINKRRSIMIHNATLAGNYRIMAEKNSIVDKAGWEKNGSKPGSILEYRRGAQGDAPREMLPQALPAAWIQLEQEAKGDLEYSLSVFSHMMGSNQDAPETYRGLLALEEKGQQKLRFKAAHARDGIRLLGMSLLKMAQKVYTGPKMIRIVGEETGEVRSLFLNQPKIDPLTMRIERMNDPSIANFDLVVEVGTSMPTNRMALLNLYLEMYQLGIIDKIEVLKKTDITNRDEVIARMSEIAQLGGQVEQMEDNLKDLSGLNQTLRRELQQREVQIGVLKELTPVKDARLETVKQEQLAQGRIKDAVVMAQKEMKIAGQKQELTAAVAIAQGNLEIEAAKREAKMEAKNDRKRVKPS